MRRAFVGLSSPLGYDYKQEASKAISDMSDSPNPILESPFGLLMLFDEIWFLCRSLCPENMRYLPYIKFLDEEGILPNLKEIKKSLNWELLKNDKEFKLRYQNYMESRPKFLKLMETIKICWDAAPDYHTHGLKIGNSEFMARYTIDNLILDIEILKRLKNMNFELVTNSFTQNYFYEENQVLKASRLSELIIIENIPNYLTPDGPYHPCIEDARSDSYLIDFRKWITNTTEKLNVEYVESFKKGVQSSIQRAQDELFLKYYDVKTHYKSIGKTLAGFVLSSFVPGVGALHSLIEKEIELSKQEESRWQAFIISSKKWKNK